MGLSYSLVVASSVGAYSPSRGPEVRDESWPTEGVRTSHYSVDKVAQEDVLDEIAAAHRELTITRLRPALIFQGEAGSEIQRYFLGGWMPVQLLRAGRLPLLPLPRGLRIQAVHAQDVAEAYAAAAVLQQPGAFNICADDVLEAAGLARIVDHGRAETLTELLQGMAEGRGNASVPMRPRDSRRARLAVGGITAGAGGGWQTLAENAEELGLDGAMFRELAGQALHQHERLDEVHAYARSRAFRVDLETHTPQD